MRLPSAPQQDFAGSVAAVLAKHDPLAGMRQAVGPRVLDRGLWRELERLGLLEPAAEGDLLTACLVAETLGRHAAPLPYLSAVVANALVAGAGGTPEGLLTYGLLDAQGTWTVSVTYRDGRISGTLPFVPDADVADGVVILADTADGPALAVVPLAEAQVTALQSLDGTQPIGRVTLDDVPASLLPAAPDLGAARNLALAAHSASLLGLMSWLLDTTVAYAGQRIQFGMPIAARQAVKHRCASMLIGIESSRAMVWELADAVEHGADDADLTAATTMAWVTETAEEVAAGALQLHGGIGFTWEHDLHHYFKRCTVGALLLGSAAHHRAAVAALLRSRTASSVG